MHKNRNGVIGISIGTIVKIRRRSPKVGKSLIKASHVSFYPSQIKKLEKIAQKEGKTTAQVIREAVKRFLNRAIRRDSLRDTLMPIRSYSFLLLTARWADHTIERLLSI